MIDKNEIAKTVEQALEGTDCFLVDVKVTPTDEITVEIDSDTGVDIDTCARVTRAIEATFDRDAEDYELEVGSAGLTAPFKVRRQYEKNLGNEVEVLTRDGKKLHGLLTAISDDGSVFTLTTTEKRRLEGEKKPRLVQVDQEIPVDQTKYVKYQINFK